MTDKQKGILVHVCAGAVIATAVAILGWTRGHGWLRMLCDGCFVAAVLLLGSGGLKFARNQGTFDMMSYSLKSVFHLHYPFAKMNSPLEEKEEDFMDYKERKRAQRKPAGELLWSGLIYLIASAVFLVIYLVTAGF